MIALSMNRTDYENDIRSLLMAFFYGEKIVLNGEEWNVCLDVRYTENHTALVLKDHNGRSLMPFLSAGIYLPILHRICHQIMAL